jgi:hypothetical protein
MAASYNVWKKNPNGLGKGGTPREEVDRQVTLHAAKLREKR